MNEEKKELLVAERLVILQGFVDYYLIKTTGKVFTELYPDIKDEYGLLNDKQSEILHSYLADVYNSFGLDLDSVLANVGEKFDGKNLTEFEKKELIRLADTQIGVVAAILNRKERLYKKV